MLIPAIAATAVVGLSLLAYARFVEPAWLRIRYRRVSIPGWHVAAEADGSPGLRILHLSDLHVGRSTGRIHRFIERAAAIPADIVAITGDFVDHPQYLPQLSEVLRSITGGDRPVLAVMGNHDRFAYEKRLVRSNPHAYNSGELIETVRALGIDLLIDELRTVPTRVGDITFVGVDLRSHDTEGLTRALGGHTGDGVVMLARRHPRSGGREHRTVALRAHAWRSGAHQPMAHAAHIDPYADQTAVGTQPPRQHNHARIAWTRRNLPTTPVLLSA
jgi:hypothetical protein